MSLFVASLNSGSNGNCYYIGTQDEAVLIDGGISCRETEKRMKRLGLPMNRVKAIFVSHEHSDHVYGIPQLSKKHQLPVYITANTRKEGRVRVKDELVRNFRPYEPIVIGSLSINAFPKFHDASDPHSFVVSSSTVRVGIFTDIGVTCEHLVRHFKQCDAAFLESNYDEYMLETGKYPLHLKKRIREGKGHLSNTQAVQLFMEHRPSFMTHLFLSHLSRNNNTPKIVKDLFSRVAGQTQIIIAPRFKETPLYHIRNLPGFDHRHVMTKEMPVMSQLSLFS